MSAAPTSQPNPTTLNVVFHGAFLFVLENNGIQVLTPVTVDHAHFAGSWKKGEIHELKKGAVYQLKGVKPAAAAPSFDQHTNIVIKAPLAGGHTSSLHSTWSLPFPKNITTLQ